MASTKTEICNLALGHLGNGKQIANIDTDTSQQALACKQFYDIGRQKVLKDYTWPKHTKQAALSLVANDPTTEWAYSYQYPSDCLYGLRVLSGYRTPAYMGQRAKYLIRHNSTGALIYTNEPSAVFEYVVNNEDEAQFDTDFVLALSYLLAMYIAPRVTGGDYFGLQKNMLALYMAQINSARANAHREQEPDGEPDGELITGRY